MLKKILFAVVPMVLFAGTVSADDDLLAKLANMDDAKIAASVDADADVEDGLGQADVDALLGDDDKDEDAIAACFRRIGYGYGYSSYGYSNYGYGSYGYSSYRCYTPTYTYYHRPVYRYCSPVVTYYTPVYTSYWGCY